MLKQSILAITVLAASTACSIYEIDIDQGNSETSAAISEINTGMTKGQVRFKLGSPLLIDPFHPDRWDYIHSRTTHEKGSKIIEHFTVVFKDDRVIEIVTRKTPKTSSN